MFIWDGSDVYRSGPDGPVNIFTLLRPTRRLEGPHGARLRLVPQVGTSAPGAAVEPFRQGSGNRLLRMEFPRNPFGTKPPRSADSASGMKAPDGASLPSAPEGEAGARPQAATAASAAPARHAVGATPRNDAEGEPWPEGDWAPEAGENRSVWSRSPIAGAIGASSESTAPPAELAPVPVSDSVETAAPDSAFNTLEWPVSDPPGSAPGRDPVGAERDVLLWQRWMRYVGAALMGAAALVLHGHALYASTWAPLLILALAYAAVTAMVAWFLAYASADTVPPKLPALIMAFDLVAAAGTVYLTTPPRDYDRLLVIGLAVVQIAVVYYGLSCALWGLGATLGAFLLGAFLLPPAVPGPRPTGLSVAADGGTFAFAGLVLLYTFGTFRARMNALRRFCRDVEVGDLGGTYDVNAERRPDDLTLLARSVEEMRQRLIELIGTDPLTGCLNRRALETRLARDCRHARRRGTPLAVLAVDVDHFKSVNDTFGHPFGDYVLHAVADIMKETARDTDAVARLGGDEFVLVLPDTGWQGATAFAERLRRNVDDHIFGDDVTSLQVTVSVGVAVARAVDDQGPAALLADADRSLYRAKSAGRNRISA
jgi:diguanylate cyclase (GGDEF)-like protein